MTSFRNAIEDPVVNEAKRQLATLNEEIRRQIQLGEVAAYALNRLSPLYATTHPGWIEQRSRAIVDSSDRITDIVSRSIQIVRRGDPLRDRTPLPESELRSPAYTLWKLQKLFAQEHLLWRDVPGCVEAALQNPRSRKPYQSTSGGYAGGRYAGTRNAALSSLKSYVKRANARADGNNVPAVPAATPDNAAANDSAIYKERDVYLLKPVLGLSNVMENLVVIVTQQQMHYLNPKVRARLNVPEVAAYALNRLPPAYATSQRGYQCLRERAKTDLARSILSVVREGILKVGQVPKSLSCPIPFTKFELEMEAAIAALRPLLQQDDITWQNAAEVIQAAIADKRKGDNSLLAV